MSTKTLLAAIAVRFSSDRQHERSLEDQERNCRRLIAQQGWEVAEDFVCKDAAKSGASVAGREGFRRLLEGARSPTRPFDVVVVDDLSRLTREAGMTMSVFKDLQQRGIRLVGVSDGFDSSRKGAKLEAGVRGLMNEAYLDDLAEKTRRGLDGQFIRGFHAGGHLFGYRSEPVYEKGARLDPHGERPADGYRIRVEDREAEVVRRIFDLYGRERLTVNAIVRKLNEEGIPWPGANTGFAATRKGWAHSSVISLIDSEKYAGRWTQNRRRWFKDSSSGKRRYVKQPEAEWLEREAPELALVSKELWAMCQTRRAEARAKFPGFGSSTPRLGPTSAPVRHLLSGLLTCGACGGSISVVGGQTKQTRRGPSDYRTYGCTNRSRKGMAFCTNIKTISLKKLEAGIVGGLQRQVLHPEAVDRFLQHFRARVETYLREKGADAERIVTEREVAKLRTEEDNLVSLCASGGVAAAIASRAIEERAAKRASLEARVAALNRQPKPEELIPDEKVMKSYLADLGALMAGDRPRARALLEKHVGKITLTAKSDGPKPSYWASGRFEFGRLDESHKCQQVAGAGFEPATFGL